MYPTSLWSVNDGDVVHEHDQKRIFINDGDVKKFGKFEMCREEMC